MRLGGSRRPGTCIRFVDASNEEILLEVKAGDTNRPLISFHLYDSEGNLVSDSRGSHAYTKGLVVEADNKEVLLMLPHSLDEDIHYRIYNSNGALLAASDGARTQIFGGLRMDSPKPASPMERSAAAATAAKK